MIDQLSAILSKNTGSATPPARVCSVQAQSGSPDLLATMLLLQTYTDDDGIYCPVCRTHFKTPEEAVDHYAKEINQALDKLAKRSK